MAAGAVEGKAREPETQAAEQRTSVEENEKEELGFSPFRSSSRD